MDKITIINEEFQNEKTGESVQGVTIIIDGKLKEVMDKLLIQNLDIQNYNELVRDALISGINSMIKKVE